MKYLCSRVSDLQWLVLRFGASQRSIIVWKNAKKKKKFESSHAFGTAYNTPMAHGRRLCMHSVAVSDGTGTQPILLVCHLLFVQICYSEWSYSLTGVHDVKMQVEPPQMSMLFCHWHISASSFIFHEDISSKQWRKDRLPTSADGWWYMDSILE